jgi:serine/threonine-protein kinase
MVRARRALVREGSARQRAEDINQFLSSMLTAADPATAPGRQVTVREVLDQAAAQLPLRFATQPLVEGPLQHDLAKVYYSLGLRPEAIDHAQRAVTLLNRPPATTPAKLSRPAPALARCSANTANSPMPKQSSATC